MRALGLHNTVFCMGVMETVLCVTRFGLGFFVYISSNNSHHCRSSCSRYRMRLTSTSDESNVAVSAPFAVRSASSYQILLFSQNGTFGDAVEADGVSGYTQSFWALAQCLLHHYLTFPYSLMVSWHSWKQCQHHFARCSDSRCIIFQALVFALVCVCTPTLSPPSPMHKINVNHIIWCFTGLGQPTAVWHQGLDASNRNWQQ